MPDTAEACTNVALCTPVYVAHQPRFVAGHMTVQQHVGSGLGALVSAQHSRAPQWLEGPLWQAGPEWPLPHLHH